MKSTGARKRRPKQSSPRALAGTQGSAPPPGLSTKQVRLLRDSFALVEPKAGIAGLEFYRQLFTLDPTLREMFQTSIELQSRKLMEALSYTISSLEKPETLVPVLESLGRRHVAYGIRDEHYETVVTALLQTLKLVLGDALTPQAHEAWKDALEFVAATMKRGAASLSALS